MSRFHETLDIIALGGEMGFLLYTLIISITRQSSREGCQIGLKTFN